MKALIIAYGERNWALVRRIEGTDKFGKEHFSWVKRGTFEVQKVRALRPPASGSAAPVWGHTLLAFTGVFFPKFGDIYPIVSPTPFGMCPPVSI